MTHTNDCKLCDIHENCAAHFTNNWQEEVRLGASWTQHDNAMAARITSLLTEQEARIRKEVAGEILDLVEKNKITQETDNDESPVIYAFGIVHNTTLSTISTFLREKYGV